MLQRLSAEIPVLQRQRYARERLFRGRERELVVTSRNPAPTEPRAIVPDTSRAIFAPAKVSLRMTKKAQNWRCNKLPFSGCEMFDLGTAQRSTPLKTLGRFCRRAPTSCKQPPASNNSQGRVRPVAQLVERRTPNLLPVRARVRDASALHITIVISIVIEPPDGDGLRSGQRPQPVEVSERGGPCPAMWAR